jgi:hypothetical protein
MKVFLMLVGGLLVMPLSAMAKKIRLEAGAVDRRDSLVELDEKVVGALPAVYRTSGGDVLQVQRSEGGVGHVVLPELAAGEVVTLEPVDMKLAEMVAAERDGSRIVFRKSGSVDPRELLTYQAEAGDLPSPEIDELYRRGGYLHPLVTPGGKMVSADFPPGHVHHHGVWFAWTSTEFQGRKPDFWNMGTGSAKVEFVSLDRFSGGTVFGELVGRHRYVDLGVTPPVTARRRSCALLRLRLTPPLRLQLQVQLGALLAAVPLAPRLMRPAPRLHHHHLQCGNELSCPGKLLPAGKGLCATSSQAWHLTACMLTSCANGVQQGLKGCCLLPLHLACAGHCLCQGVRAGQRPHHH